ncbi:Fe-S cluster assembly protein NifU [bacterium]|nr:Fe-S cluster assembly protein NifU [bacterium]
MWDYTEKVKEYFLHPRNVGEIKNPDAEATVGNIICGDSLKLTLKINKKTGIIEDAKFKTFGCGSAIASSSALTEMIIGKTVEEAEKITNKDIADFLGGLPDAKMHCSVMGREALEDALAKYKGIDIEKVHKEREHIVCKCFGVTEEEIVRVVKENNLKTVEEVTNYTKAGGGCGECKPRIQALLNEILHIKEEPIVKEGKHLTNLEKIKLIEKTIDQIVRPGLKLDGGDIELVDVVGNEVIVKFKGVCKMCEKREVTLELFVQKALREHVSKAIVVKAQE